jgi:hypothetical protein
MPPAEVAGKSDLSQFACPNRGCAWYGKRPAEGGKLWVDRRRGRDEIGLLRCAHCRKTFSERRGTALEEARLPAAEGEQMVAHRQEGGGIRRTARLTGPARRTGSRSALVVGAHARAVHDETRRGVTCAEIQADEKWAFVGEKRGPLRR